MTRGLIQIALLVLISTVPIIQSCSPAETTKGTSRKPDENLLYLNHSDTVTYVGMTTCKSCHPAIYESYIRTGMGRSIGRASEDRSSAAFNSPHVYDRIAGLRYKAFFKHDSLFIHEYRLENRDTVHSRTEQVNFIIGSGQHTNSHIHNENGYLSQMPMTWYSQKKKWDLPPGFENGVNTRFSRKIGLECMSCHNAFPDFVTGSENKFTHVPEGIDCERCHGPGSAHVALRRTGSRIDTSKYIDYSVVNPAKLSVDLQFDICQRCHLQGNTVLKEGKSFFDFRPGQKLSDYMSVFLPRYQNRDDEFIMASHADRLKQSPCFIKSMPDNSEQSSLKPYKNALTCVTCHNPHVSVKETNGNVFNDACLKCHGSGNPNGLAAASTASLVQAHGKLGKKWSNCVSCHMPSSGSTDIPHVTIHDHFIRKPVTKEQYGKIKTFAGLHSVNEKHPVFLTRAKAYLNQYEKFEQESYYLDSAGVLISKVSDEIKRAGLQIRLHFAKKEYEPIRLLVAKIGEEKCMLRYFNNKSHDNEDAWNSYRIGESFASANDVLRAKKWFEHAVQLAPFYPEFRNKFGAALATNEEIDRAEEQFNFILKENPEFAPAYANLGYIKLFQGYPAEAQRLYKLGLAVDPDHTQLLLNLAAFHLYNNDRVTAKKYIQRVLKNEPGNRQAIEAMEMIRKKA